MTQIIWIARHGSRLDFADPEWCINAPRPHDPPLSPNGMHQGGQLAQRLKPERITHLFSSPFLRAVETANVVAEDLDLSMRIEPGFSEWLNRAWFPAPPETLSVDELARRFPRIDRDYRPRGSARYGESGEEALRRSGETAVRLAHDFREDFLIVGHGASVLGATAGLLRLAPDDPAQKLLPQMPFGCLVKLVRQADAWVMELACDTSHLKEIGGGDRFV
jgi:broad specificity phosphatase PhoE